MTGCIEDKCELTKTFEVWNPVYVQMDEVRQDIQMEGPRQLEQPGKIYFYQDMIFINEYRKGIHVIDNQDPTSPNPIAFINIPGNVDMAAIGNLLYADNYVDLVTISIEQPDNPQFVSRTEDVFPSHSLNQDLGHLVYYEPSQQVEEVPCTSPNWGRPFWVQDERMFVSPTLTSGSFDAANAGSSGASSGIGGSLARFTLAAGHLYVVDESTLRVFDLSTLTQPELVSQVGVGWGIETIFPYGDHLFIGSNTGMFIFDNTNPVQTKFIICF